MTRILIVSALALGVVLLIVAFGQADPFDDGDNNRIIYLLLSLLLVGGGAWGSLRSQSLGRILTFAAIWIAIGVAGAGVYLLIYGADVPSGWR